MQKVDIMKIIGRKKNRMKKKYLNSSDNEKLLIEYYDINDPRSISYKRILTYPKINYITCLINVSLFIITYLGFTFILQYYFSNIFLTIFLPLSIALVYINFRLKSIVIFMIEIYQLLAPKKTRMRCRFEPSCSDYMIFSIRKYGVRKGLIKGIKRLKRCCYPNGGYDEP